jgi:predicted amidophosphoribosyltransferase
MSDSSLELIMGHTHRCVQCRSTFLAHEDGCPICGSSLVDSLSRVEFNDRNQEVWYWMIIEEHSKLIEYIFPGDSCPWPRLKG